MQHVDQQLAVFAKGQKNNKGKAITAVMYTRVSTKEQADNNQSLFTQAKHIKQFAMNNDLQIIGEFGGTYESAKSDERVQFKQMIAFVKRHKVDAIVVYSMDRFSRSGPNAIYISEQLRKIGTEIISVTQPVDASTAAGELQQGIYFMFSQYENQQRRLKSMAGTREKLLQGHWVTKPPLGYKKITEGGQKKIVITKEGRLLAAAFRRKIKYNYEFTEISKWLSTRGLKVSHKRLSELCRNVFYCGFMAHQALNGEIVKGNHEGLITRNEFLKLNGMLQIRPAKKPKSKMLDHLPLKRHMHCSKCSKPMTGYFVRPKKLYYYKCNTKGCKVNRSAKVLNRNWEQTLSNLQIDAKYVTPIQEQLKRKLESLKEDSGDGLKQYRSNKTKVERKIEMLEERFVIGEITKDLFDKYAAKYREELVAILEEIDKCGISLSNPDQVIKQATDLMSKLQKTWQLSKSTERSKLLKAVYPSGIWLDPENNSYRTFGLNPAVRCILDITGKSVEKEKRNSEDKLTYSALVGQKWHIVRPNTYSQ